MPSITKTLIINVSPLDQNLKAAHSPQRRRRRLRTPKVSQRKLKTVLWLLNRLGYRFATISQALAAPSPRTVCLVLESAAHAPASSKVIATLKTLEIPATLFVATGSVSDFAPLAELSKAGFEIGSLGHEAVDLTTRGYLEQRQLVAKGRAAFAALHRPARIFAYPFGAYDTTTLSCLKEEGFVAAISGHQGVNGADADRYQLRQIRFSKRFFADLWQIVRLTLSPSPNALPAGIHSDREHIRSGVAL